MGMTDPSQWMTILGGNLLMIIYLFPGPAHLSLFEAIGEVCLRARYLTSKQPDKRPERRKTG